MNIPYDRKQVSNTIVSVLAFLFLLPPVFAQEWKDYKNQKDGFTAQFPGEPRVSETTWKSEASFTLPERIYSLELGPTRYSVTVVDYTGIQALGRARLKTCPEATDETCNGTPLSGEGYWKHDLRGAMLYATRTLIARDDVQVKDIAWNQISRISTISLSFTNTRDGSRTYALVTMNERKLYIVQGTVPKQAPYPLQFGGSFSIFNTAPAPAGVKPNANGGFAYPSLYSNEIYGVGDVPPPATSDTAGGAGDYRPHEFDNVPIPPYPLPKGIASDGRPVGSGPRKRDDAPPPQRKTP
jgi:hypothetical protein